MKLIKEDINKCCICNKEIKGYGNNAEPVKKGTCCDKCNREVVIPARMKNIHKESLRESTNKTLYHYSNILYEVGDEIIKHTDLSPEVVEAYKKQLDLNPENLVYMLDHQDESYEEVYKYCYEVTAPFTFEVKMDYSPIMCQDYLDRTNKKFDSFKVAESFARLYDGDLDNSALSILKLEESDKKEYIADKDVKVKAICNKEEINESLDDDSSSYVLVVYEDDNDEQEFSTTDDADAFFSQLADMDSEDLEEEGILGAIQYEYDLNQNKFYIRDKFVNKIEDDSIIKGEGKNYLSVLNNNLTESKKKKSKQGYFVKMNTGDVEKGIEIFNSSIGEDYNESSNIDIRKVLNKIDWEHDLDLRNTYDALFLSEEQKKQIVNLIYNNDLNKLQSYLENLYNKEFLNSGD